MHANPSTCLRFIIRTLWALSLCVLLFACRDEQQSIAPATSDPIPSSRNSIDSIDPEFTAPTHELIIGYLQQIELDFTAVEAAMEAMQSEISDFIDQPNAATLASVRNSWIDAHRLYELTALHRYFARLILTEQDSLTLFQLQYQINHWPILPGYIDYVDGYPDSGIVHDVNVPLDVASLREQHGFLDISEAILGFHVLEYLIWGANEDGNSPRPASDYLAATQLSASQAENGYVLDQLANNRRRVLLTIVGQAILEDFQQTSSLWSLNATSFRQRLGTENTSPIQAIDNVEPISTTQLLVLVIDAMTTMLTEELLVRSLYPMLNGDFTESIQSSFSHSTQNAVSSQLSGLERLLLESQTESGTTLDSLFSLVSVEFSEFFYQNFDASKECLILLYSDLDRSPASDTPLKSEFEVVECINLLTNMIDYLEQLKFGLSN